MTLPNFPIRTRLIPYDDLGIQEVSPNLLSLQNDVDIVLAALMAMGKNGSQMLQSDNYGALYTNDRPTGNLKDVGRLRTLVEATHITSNSESDIFDIGSYINVLFILQFLSNSGTSPGISIHFNTADNHDNYVDLGALGHFGVTGYSLLPFSFSSAGVAWSNKSKFVYTLNDPDNDIELYIDALLF